MNRLRCFTTISGLIVLCACAHARLIRPSPVPVKLAPFQSRVNISRYKYIHETPSNMTRAEELTLVQGEMSRIEQTLADSFSAKLSSAGFVVAPSTATARLQIETSLDAYGRVPGKWLFVLIGSGLGEGIFQGVVLAKASGSTWAGVGIGLEELLQETVTWGGGAFLTNRYLVPIILSCRIVRISDHKTLWSDHEISIYSRGIVKSLPPGERHKRQAQLTAVASHSLDELVRSIQHVWPKIARKLH